MERSITTTSRGMSWSGRRCWPVYCSGASSEASSQTRAPEIATASAIREAPPLFRSLEALDHRQGIARRRAGRRVVEDAPRGDATASQVPQLAFERTESVVLIGGVVDPRRTMEPEVREPAPPAGFTIAA